MAGTKQHDLAEALRRWHVDAEAVREQLYRAPTPRERERWHAVWLALQGWPAAQVAAALGRDAHTVGGWLAALRRDGPAALTFPHTGGSPPP
jgi:transposase